MNEILYVFLFFHFLCYVQYVLKKEGPHDALRGIPQKNTMKKALMETHHGRNAVTESREKVEARHRRFCQATLRSREPNAKASRGAVDSALKNGGLMDPDE